MSNNEEDNNDNPRIITLEQPEPLKKTNLVKTATYNIDTEIINVSLNSEINSSIVWTADKKKWTNNHKMMIDQAIELGLVDKELHFLLKRLINDNADNILRFYNSASSASTAAGGIGDNGGIFANNNTAETIVKLVMENGKLFKK